MINMKKVKLVLPCLLIVIVFFSAFYSVAVNAVTVTQLGNAYWGIRENRPQLRTLLHTDTNRIISVSYYESTMDKLHITVVDAGTGVLYADQVYDVAISGYGGSDALSSVNIIQLDDNEVLISGNHPIVSTSYLTTVFIRFNVLNYNTVKSTVAGTSETGRYSGSQLFEYNNYFWLVGKMDCQSETNIHYFIHRFDPATNTATEQYESGNIAVTNGAHCPFYAFQDPDNLEYIYAMFSVTDLPQQMKLYVIDLSTPASGYTELATLASTGGTPDNVTSPNSPYLEHCTLIGGGIYTESTYYYLYFIYSYSTTLSGGWGWSALVGSQRISKLYMPIFQFNNTINAGTLITQTRRTTTVYDSSGAQAVVPSFNYGYIVSSTSNYPDLIRMFYSDTISGHYISQVDAGVTDITDMGKVVFDDLVYQDGVDDIDFNYVDQSNKIAKPTGTGYSYQEQDNTHSYITTGEIIIGAYYNVVLTYTPSDTPLLTNKQYLFETYVTMNGYVYSGSVEWMVDTISKGTSLLVGGYATKLMTFTVGGIHQITINVLDDNEIVYFESYNYTFVDNIPDVGDVDTIRITAYEMLTSLMIPVVVILIPTVIMMSIMPNAVVGAGIGLALGSGMGFVAGIIPFSLFIIFLILTTIALFATSRGQ